MAIFSGAQVLTARELKIGDVMHCGRTGGVCMRWKVVGKDEGCVYVKVGAGSIVRMTGRDIRDGLPMFRASECPICSKSAQNGIAKPTRTRDSESYTVHELLAADVRSSLSGVDNVRKKNTTNTGGAVIDTPTKRRKAVTQQLVQRLMRGT